MEEYRDFKCNWDTHERKIEWEFKYYEALLDLNNDDFYAWRKYDKKVVRREHDVTLKQLDVLITTIYNEDIKYTQSHEN